MEQTQAHTGLLPAQTVLAGFSQGAIMSLESTQVGPPLAARVVALRDALPESTSPSMPMHPEDVESVMPTAVSLGAPDLSGLPSFDLEAPEPAAALASPEAERPADEPAHVFRLAEGEDR